MGIAKGSHVQTDHVVNVMLTGGRVTSTFREALFAAAGRAGIPVNQFVIEATAEKLIDDGFVFSGVFRAGDLDHSNDNTSRERRKRA